MSYPMNMTVGQIRELVENPGTPIRPPATAVMTIDSRDRVRIDPATGYRIDTTTPYEVYINKQQTLMNGYFTRIAMSEINMQWNTPNVIGEGPCKNNTLLLEQAADPESTSPVIASVTLTVPQSFYTPLELANVLQLLLNAGAGTFGATDWVVQYNERLNTFGIFFPTAVANPLFRIRPQNIGSADDLCNLMGFSYPPSSFTDAVYGSYASMQYTPYFDVVSDNLTKKQNVRDNSTSFLTGQNLLCRVYLSEPGVNVARDRTVVPGTGAAETTIVGCRPFNLYREYSTPKQIYWDTKEFINVIDLRLVDYKGRTLYSQPQLGSNIDIVTARCGDSSQFQLTLQVTET
jgi:hypothetical protein